MDNIKKTLGSNLSTNKDIINFIIITFVVLFSPLIFIGVFGLMVGGLFNGLENKEQIETVATMNDDLQSLKIDIDRIDSTISSKSSELSTDQVNYRLLKLEDNYQSLSNTILLDTNKAITSGVLIEKNKHLEKMIEYLRDEQRQANERFSTFSISIIASIIISIWMNRSKNK
jgi:hypothetical protein